MLYLILHFNQSFLTHELAFYILRFLCFFIHRSIYILSLDRLVSLPTKRLFKQKLYFEIGNQIFYNKNVLNSPSYVFRIWFCKVSTVKYQFSPTHIKALTSSVFYEHNLIGWANLFRHSHFSHSKIKQARWYASFNIIHAWYLVLDF